jgi:AraC-like DNA-binding protein
MDFRALPPPPALAPWVSMIWRLQGEGGGDEFDTVLPDGSVELIFHLGEPFTQRVGNADVKQEAAFVVGDIRRPVSIRPSRRADVIGIRFRPGRAYPFFNTPMAAMADGITPLCESRWQDMVFESPNPIECLSSMLRPRTDDDRSLHACVDAIVATNGATTIKRVAGHIGLSVRQLERKFERGVGIPAKTFARVIRFHSVAEQLRDDTRADDGYSDQSHLIREFREFAGVTPGHFLRRPGSLTELFLG